MAAVEKNVNMSSNKQNKKCSDEALLEPLTYITQVPSKNIRPKLIRAFNHWLNVAEEKVIKIESITQLLHNGSLLIDDIQDDAVLRRGLPVAHFVFGVPSTMNAASYIVLTSLTNLTEIYHPDTRRVMITQMLEMIKGQGMELHWRNTYTCPTEEEYRGMAIKKTSALFRLAIELMQLHSTSTNDFSDLADTMGLLFQIADDYKSLNFKEYFENKSYCEDLTEGKFGFPVVHAIQNNPNDHQIISIIRQRTQDVELKKYCVSLLEKYGSFEYTRKTIKKLKKEVEEEIQKLGGNDQLMEIVDYFCSNIF